MKPLTNAAGRCEQPRMNAIEMRTIHGRDVADAPAVTGRKLAQTRTTAPTETRTIAALMCGRSAFPDDVSLSDDTRVG
jgi:hypothetical protein